MSKQLPERPNLEHLRKQAKDLLSSFRSADPEAIARLAALPAYRGADLTGRRLGLHDAQSAIAREYGFESWTRLVAEVEAIRAREGITDEVVERFARLAVDEAPGSVERMLSLYPGLPQYNITTALMCGQTERVSSWLQDHSVDESLPPFGWKPIEHAAWSGAHRRLPDGRERALDVVKLLLEAGADANTSHQYQEGTDSPLSILYGATCHAQHEGIVRLLLERGANPNDGESVFHSAQLNLLSMLELLVEHGADISFADPYWGNTPLYFNAGHRVSDSGYERAMQGCEWLLQHGADPNVRSGKCQETPLFPSVRNGNLRLVQLLLDHGADPDLPNRDGLTPYMFAAVTGAGDVLQVLADRGANTALPEPGPFLADCAMGRKDAVRDALRRDPELVQKLSDRERSVICKMAEMGRTLGVETCLDAGFPVDTRGEENAIALHFACYCQWDETASLLIKRGAPLEARDSTYDGTPLAWVLEGFLWNRNPRGNGIRIVKELLAAGASDENLRHRLETSDAATPAMQELLEDLNR